MLKQPEMLLLPYRQREEVLPVKPQPLLLLPQMPFKRKRTSRPRRPLPPLLEKHMQLLLKKKRRQWIKKLKLPKELKRSTGERCNNKMKIKLELMPLRPEEKQDLNSRLKLMRQSGRENTSKPYSLTTKPG